MSSALTLVVLNGDQKGEVFPLSPDQPTRIGRSAKGAQLIDPQVSMLHAEVAWEGDTYWVEDKGSATGTFVNGTRVAEKAIALKLGSVLRIGETELEVSVKTNDNWWKYLVAAGALGLLGWGASAALNQIERDYNPQVRWYEAVSQGGGYSSDLINIPTSFTHRTGIDDGRLKIDAVTDYDENGVDELWLSWPGGRELVTFDNAGDWKRLSALPDHCERREVSQTDVVKRGFPNLECGGPRYIYTPGKGYTPAGLEGVIVWMAPTEPASLEEVGEDEDPPSAVVKRGPAVPYRLSSPKTEQLAGFFEARGIIEPVHYVVCEGFRKGVRAQVLTASGARKPMSKGCLGDLSTEGVNRLAMVGEAKPLAVAFTATGVDALQRDTALNDSGHRLVELMSPALKKSYAALTSRPLARQGGVSLRARAAVGGQVPVAREGKLTPKERLLRMDDAPAAPPLLNELTIFEDGKVRLDGCLSLEVSTASWMCLKDENCQLSQPFATFTPRSCQGDAGEIRLSYEQEAAGFQVGDYQGKVVMDRSIARGEAVVQRLRVRWMKKEATLARNP